MESLHVITLDVAIAATRQVIEDYGMENLTYRQRMQIMRGVPESAATTCVYFTEVNGNLVPACIVAVVLSRLGLKPEQVVDVPGVGSSTLNSQVCRNLFTYVDKIGEYNVVTQDAIDFLREVQSAQDNNTTWGEALNRGLTLYPENTDQGFSEKADTWEVQSLINLGRNSEYVMTEIRGLPRKIQAIKALRTLANEQSGTVPSLINTKNAVEALIAETNPPF